MQEQVVGGEEKAHAWSLWNHLTTQKVSEPSCCKVKTDCTDTTGA